MLFILNFNSCISTDQNYMNLETILNHPIISLRMYYPGEYSPNFVTLFVLYRNGNLYYADYENGRYNNYYVKISQNKIEEFIRYLSINDSIYDLETRITLNIPVDPDPSFTGRVAYMPVEYIIELDIDKAKIINVRFNYILNNTSVNMDGYSSDPIYQLLEKIINYRNNNARVWNQSIPY